MSKYKFKKSHSSLNDENIPNNSQTYTTTALSKSKPEKRIISHKDQLAKENIILQLASSADTGSTVTEKIVEEYEEAVEEDDKVIEDENAVEEEVLKEDNVGSFSEPVYRGDGNHHALNFRDKECGEPFRNQHLRIDFSPIEGVDDNEFIMKKCHDFWMMIEENPRIHGLRVSPKSDYDKGLVRSTFSEHTKNVYPTATNWLKHSPEIISEAFTTKNKKYYCDDTDDNMDWAMKTGRTKDLVRERLGVSVTAQSVSRKSRVKASSSAALTDATALCRQMEAWDLSHPK